ncbi:MAG: MBL fold metallo-hydrolase [Verrucomicrobia bacterium]|nr:MBL fold metallo-hydrolase [Verrucomicrobiota bacterium]
MHGRWDTVSLAPTGNLLKRKAEWRLEDGPMAGLLRLPHGLRLPHPRHEQFRQLLLITHEHSDHCIGLAALLRQNPALKVFANRETARRIQGSLKVKPDWQLFETGTTFELGRLQVTSIPIPHDAADPVGYAIDCPAEDGRSARRVTWLTDLGHATDVVRHHCALADILVLEANYDDEMLDLSKRPLHLKQRIRGNHGHLSNHAARDLLLGLREWQTSELFLGHLSKECNRTVLVDEVMNAVRQHKGDLRVTVVDPLEDDPVSTW